MTRRFGNNTRCTRSRYRSASVSADHTLNTLEPECSGKWRKYFQLKQLFYMAYVSTSCSRKAGGLEESPSSPFHLLPLPRVCRPTATTDRRCWRVTSAVRPSDPCRRRKGVRTYCQCIPTCVWWALLFFHVRLGLCDMLAVHRPQCVTLNARVL